MSLMVIFCQVEMKDVKNVKFIESVINQNDFRVFVCSNRDDLRLFLDEVQYRYRMKFNFKIVNFLLCVIWRVILVWVII